MSTEIEALLDREKIRDCIGRIARGEDRRDADLLRGAYWPDATDDHGVFKGTIDEYVAWVVPGAPQIPVTMHTLGQSFIDLRGAAAFVETHVTSYHRINMGSEERDIVLGGRYLDKLEKRGAEWRVAHRTMMYDWFSDYGQSIDWANGLLGMPFLGDHYTGVAHGDYSEKFFKR